MDLKKEKHGAILVLALRGRLNALNASELKPEIEVALASGENKVVFDLENLSQVDSSGISAIVSVYKRTRYNDGNTAIANLTEQPRDVFTILNLHKAIAVYNSVDEAVNSFGL